jgi:hypothetical protein
MYIGKAFGEKDREFAYRISLVHLSRLGKSDYGARFVKSVAPCRDSEGKENRIFEVKLAKNTGDDGGYILVSIDARYIPVLAFSLSGPTISERIAETCKVKGFALRFFTPFYLTAESAEGREIGSFGHPPDVYSGNAPSGGKKPGKELAYETFSKCFAKHQDLVLAKKQKAIAQSWERMNRDLGKIKAGSDQGVDPSDYYDLGELPSHNHEEVVVPHPEAIPRYNQIGPSVGANAAHDFYTGCTSCAWMGLIGYHDNATNGDILRGSNTENDTISFDGYQDRILVDLSEY